MIFVDSYYKALCRIYKQPTKKRILVVEGSLRQELNKDLSRGTVQAAKCRLNWIPQRVHLDCQYGIRTQKPYMVWFLGPDSILAVEMDPLGSDCSSCEGRRKAPPKRVQLQYHCGIASQKPCHVHFLKFSPSSVISL